MLFVGIDIAKNKHDMAVINSDGKVILKHLTFKNNTQGFDHLHSKIMELVHNHETDVYIAFEDTGHYGLNLQTFLRKYYINSYSYNPLLIKKFADAQSLRKTKTDKKDALLIARKLLSDFAELDKPVITDTLMIELKFATCNRSRLTQIRSDAKVQYTNLFPELTSVIAKHNQSTYTLLKKFPSAKAIANARPSSLTKIKRINLEKALKLKETAKISIGTHSDTLTISITEHRNNRVF